MALLRIGGVCGQRNSSVASARREIELLREYRERLIADVVTGKVAVREVAARLPDVGATSRSPLQGDGLAPANGGAYLYENNEDFDGINNEDAEHDEAE